jgi:hypothetical protein
MLLSTQRAQRSREDEDEDIDQWVRGRVRVKPKVMISGQPAA